MTDDEINALPKRVRDYIHELSTRADPAFEVQQRWALIEVRDGLVGRVRELEAEVTTLKRAAARRRSPA